MSQRIKRRFIKFISLWPPFLGMGIRVQRIAPDFREIDVCLKLRFWNRNYVGTHFGGSLFAMADPFFMLMLIENLGPEYIVWDKAAGIRFRKPGRGEVRAEFRLTQRQIDAIVREVELHGKHEETFRVEIRDRGGEVVAEVEKLIQVRKKLAGERVKRKSRAARPQAVPAS